MPRTVTIKTWDALVRLADDYPQHLFRGQAEARWNLDCSLHRTLEANSFYDDCDVIEYFLLREFRRGARRYISQTPGDHDYVAWLGLMQHHGTPTRLLDFTHSFYVAVYFALINAVHESALWIVDPEFLFRAAGIPRHRGRNGVPAEWEEPANQLANKFLASRLSSALISAEQVEDIGVIPVEPMDLHHRLAIQQGVFLMPKNAFLTIEQNLQPVLKRSKRAVIKVVISPIVRPFGLRHLKSMNITAETLFPGIDGFARSLLHAQIA